MDITEYRTRVRDAVACPASQCLAPIGGGCSNVYGTTNPVRKPLEYVHDDRSLAYHLLAATAIDETTPDAPEYAGRPAVHGLCPDCRGSGYKTPGRGERCPRCQGEGRVDELEHSAACVGTKGHDRDCPSYFVIAHPDGDGHCSDCHCTVPDPDGPHCNHWAGCPGC